MVVVLLLIQSVILVACAAVVVDWARRFPHPSRVVKPLLPPEHRWPGEQLREWVEEGSPDPGFIRFFLRDPERPPPTERGLLAPVDGTVLANLERDGRRFLVISLNVWDVHVARSPCDGHVVGVMEHGDMIEPSRNDPLRDEPFYFLREKRSPKQRALEVDTELGLMRIRFVTSYLSRRIELFLAPGDRVERGQRVGRMLFGSTCVLETDAGVRYEVKVGERTLAGTTIIARPESVR
jgi:phosphatidylserine decarboxylase